jgi:hypothetical protein
MLDAGLCKIEVVDGPGCFIMSGGLLGIARRKLMIVPNLQLLAIARLAGITTRRNWRVRNWLSVTIGSLRHCNTKWWSNA